MADRYFAVGKNVVRSKSRRKPGEDSDPVETVGWGTSPARAVLIANALNAADTGKRVFTPLAMP